MTRARYFRLAVSLALALVVVGLGGLSVYRKVQAFQSLGFDATLNGAGVSVSQVQDARTGLRDGDQILMVNGVQVETRDQLRRQLRERPESELSVQRGADFLPNLQYQRPPLNPDIPYLLLSLIGALYLAIGLYTLLRHGGAQSFLFYLWCLSSAALYLLTPVRPVDVAYKAIDLCDTAAYLLLPALMVHLFMTFPAAQVAQKVRRVIPFLYLPGAALMTLQLDMMLTGGRWFFGAPTVARIQLLEKVELIHFTLVSAAALAVLVWRFRRDTGWEQHRQMQWMAYGVVGGYLPFLAFYAPSAFGWSMPELLTSATVLPLAAVPLTFAYAILRYKLWDIEVIVRDTISWTMTLLLGIIGFSLVNLGISRGVSQELALARNVLMFVSGLGIAGLLVPTRSVISSALERFQYRGTFGKRQALSGFGRELLHERDLGRICSSLLQRIEEGVELEKTNLYLVQGDELTAFHLEPDLPERLPADLLGEETWTRDVHQLSGVAMPAGEMPLPTRLFVAGYRYVFPLTVRGRSLGLVLTSFRQDHTPLNSEDSELIRHLLNQAALAIENAQLVGQLQVQLEEVQRLQRYTEGIFESSPAGIAVLDGERRLLSVNAAFAGIAGKSREELIGRGLEGVLPVQPLPAAGEGPVDVSWCDADGRERYLQLSLANFERGWRQGLYVLVVHDVSERVAMENALREKDRLAALGMLAAGVAHEVNTPITGISSYAQMLLEDTAQSDPHYDILKKVERQTFRAARIVNNLLEFARRRQNEPKPVELAPLITESLDLLGDRIGKRRIALDWTPPADKIQVVGCDGELQQVFTNLILNAVDA
ncbi:MAG TPA: histidine kinase dimerization/phospho-acceptor domain-containing protein, partial [Thermoanaerobaculia bacterium]